MVLTSLLLCVAQSGVSGTYQPVGGSPMVWNVNQHHALIWNGAPYVPVGVRVSGSRAAIAQALDAGVRDVIIELPADGSGWGAAIEALEAKGARYLIAINSAAPAARGIAVQPQTYRRAGVNTDGVVTFPSLGAKTALSVLAVQRDGSIAKEGKVEADGSMFSIPVVTDGLDHVLLLYPEIQSMSQPDYWDAFDAHRDDLLAAINSAKLGPGFRGLLDPVGKTVSLYGKPKSFVPTASAFRIELKGLLTERYRNVATALKAWRIAANDIESLDQMARLVPLWRGTERGVTRYWDPERDITYRCDSRDNSAWDDIDSTIQSAAVRRYDRLVAAIRQRADVPVLQTWNGWRGPYELNSPSLSGVAGQAMGPNPSRLASTAAGAASSAMRWTKPGWLIASDADQCDVPSLVAELSAMGYRGFFAKSTEQSIAEAAAASGDSTLATWSPRAIFFPEAAANPARAQRLPNGHFWLPAPYGGVRLEYGSLFNGYRYDTVGGPVHVIFAKGPVRAKLIGVDFKLANFQTVDGIDPKIKAIKNGVELNLSDIPIVISGIKDVPIPELSYQQTIARFQSLKKLAESLKRDLYQEEYSFREAAKGFERVPSNFGAMRRNYWLVTSRLAPYTWIEAESVTKEHHNFSDQVQISGANNALAIELDSVGSIDGLGSFAEYNVPVRFGEDQDIWVSARVPKGAAGDITIKIMGQDFKLPAEPITTYGPDFGWYKVGTTRLSGNSTVLRLEVRNVGPVHALFDTFFIAPVGLMPVGPLPPEIVN